MNHLQFVRDYRLRNPSSSIGRSLFDQQVVLGDFYFWRGRTSDGTRRITVRTQYVVQRRFEIGETESFDHHAVDVRQLAAHRLGSFDPHDRPDADRRVDRRPEMKLMRRIGPTLRRDDPADSGR